MDKQTAMENLIKAQFDYIQAMGNSDIDNLSIVCTTPNFSDYVIEYLENAKKIIKKSTYSSYKWALHRVIIPFLGKYKLNEINSKTLQLFANHLLEKYKIKTVKGHISLVKTILRTAEDDEIIKAQKINVRLPKNNKSEYRILTDEEYNKLLDYCIESQKPKALGVLIALKLGLRIGELCGLKWDDVDFKQSTVTVQRTIYRACMINEKSEIVVDSPKTPKSRRKIFISSQLLQILKKRKPKNINAYILTGKQKPTEPRQLREFFMRILKKLEIPHIKFHELRHSFATRAISKNIDPKTVSEILGHTNCKISLDIYTNCTERMMRNAVEILG